MTVLQPHRAEVLPYFERLKRSYVDYCTGVSLRSMALSIETCAYVWWLCDTLQLRTVADLGSGYSSFVLREYATAADYPVTVTSVDSDPDWLAKSREFCHVHGHTDDRFHLGDEWARIDARYDLIVNDYDKGRTRESFADIAIGKLSPAGVIVFDDAQNADHHHHAAAACIDGGLAFLDPYHQTVDEVGRFACIGARR